MANISSYELDIYDFVEKKLVKYEIIIITYKMINKR